MKRINLLYDGLPYSIGRVDYDALKIEIEDAVLSGKPYWLTVNYGEGSFRETEILITSGVGLALIGVDPPDSPDDGPSEDASNAPFDSDSL